MSLILWVISLCLEQKGKSLMSFMYIIKAACQPDIRKPLLLLFSENIHISKKKTYILNGLHQVFCNTLFNLYKVWIKTHMFQSECNICINGRLMMWRHFFRYWFDNNHFVEISIAILNDVTWGPVQDQFFHLNSDWIRWKFHSVFIQLVRDWLLSNFAHDTAAVLSCLMRNCVAISHTKMQ